MERNNTTQSNKIFSEIKQIIGQNTEGYCTIYKMECLDGLGMMRVYQVFPGIELVYNKFEATTCLCAIPNYDNIMEINYCKGGLQECELLSGSYLYLGQGDMSVHMMSNHSETMGFPLKHYQGISVILHLDEISKELPEILKDVSIDIYSLKKKFCANNQCFIMRAKDKIEHIFSELYSVPESVQKAYFKLKVLELLLFLSTIDISKEEQSEYYSQQQVDTIKRIRKKITEDSKQRYTIPQLAKEYRISPTTLKKYFKIIYGTSIAAYMKDYRVKQSTVMLRQTKNSVADIALDVGYESQSKFAATFKEIIGISPLQYRKKCLAEVKTA